jgi:hypothetical protein
MMRARRSWIEGALVAMSVSIMVGVSAPGVATAAVPTSTVLDVSSSFTNNFDCPFTLQEQVSGFVKDTQYFDQSGTILKEVLTAQYQGPVTVTWTNNASGVTLASHEADPLTIYYTNGRFSSLSSRGLTFHVSIPGFGTVLLDVGQIVIMRGQGITLQAGQHQELEGDTAAFCAALS